MTVYKNTAVDFSTIAMDHNSPHALHTNDYFYICGTYEAQ